MKRNVILGVVLLTFWMLLSGHFTPLFLVFAVLSVVLVMLISFRMDLADQLRDPIHLTPALLSYWLWLAKETVASNIDMVKRVWQRTPKIAPAVSRIKTTQTTRMGKVIYANSITLTPGTVTLDIDEEACELEVHSIDYELLKDLMGGDMDRRVSRLEK